jgi:hypothetical protein
MYHHPKYYKEMRAERRKQQAASLKRAINETVPWNEVIEAQAASVKPQAEDTSDTSSKRQAPSSKHQASSRKRQAAQ